MESIKVYVVKLFERGDKDPTPLKVFSSFLKARNYCEDEAQKLCHKDGSIEPEDHETCWEDNMTYVVKVNDVEWIFDIFEIPLDEDVADVSRPEVEVENEFLRKENIGLREKLSKQAAMNAAARCYATMWDGGWKYTKEHVIENLHVVKSILEGNEESKNALDKMFENWQKSKCKSCSCNGQSSI